MPPTSTAKRRSSRISGKQTVESDMNVDSDRRPVKGKPTKNVNNKSKLPNTSEPKNSSLHKSLKVTRSSRFNAKSLKSASAENEETSKINAALTVTRKTRAVKRSTINSNKATVLTTVTRSSRNRSSDNSDSDQDPVETVPTSSTRRSSSNNLKNSLKARRAKPPKPYRESSENDEVTDNEPVTAKPRKRSRSRSKPSTKVTRSSRPNAAVNQNLTFIDSLNSEQDPKPVSTSVTRCASQHLDSDPHSSEDKDANDGDSSTVYTSSTSEYEASEDPSSDSSGFTDARDSHYDETEKKPKPVFKASTTPKFKFFSIPKGDAKPGPSRPRQPKPPKKAKKQVHESDDEISDWEDVEDSPPRKRRLNPEDIQVTVIKSEEQKKNETLEAELKAERSKRRRLLCKSVHEFFIYGHVAHLHCYLKRLLSDDSDFLNVCLEAIPVNVQLKKSLKNLEAFLKWFKATFTKAKDSVKERAENRKKLTETMELLLRKQAYVTNRDMCTLLFSFLVSLKFTARLGLALAITSEDAILEWIDAGKKKSLPEIPIDQNYFVEVWSPSGKKWISLDPIRTSWSEPFKTAEAFTEGFNYVVAIDNVVSGVREVTPRYTENYLTYAYRKTRPGADFLKELPPSQLTKPAQTSRRPSSKMNSPPEVFPRPPSTSKTTLFTPLKNSF
ncbi:hypothetical protein L596_010738 [Steinernema carpocapsae]|uniref:Rad4/PNGase transglutaminase-like fold domain-containing protein n=1 Tax=Steinernema carpocapsae TaxID=34508 RepID=A0A4U5PJQ9_STECR|nr:hypothetical protein L596_010738 [Steinernema carpocapsae]